MSLLAAAQALQAELDDYAARAGKLEDLEMRSKKHLERAGRMLQEIADSEARIGDRLSGFNDALNQMRETQQRLGANVHENAKRIEQRTLQFDGLMQRYAALGQEALALNRELGANANAVEADAKLTCVLEDAEGIWRDARAQDFFDVAQEADSLRQQLGAIRNKLRKLLA